MSLYRKMALADIQAAFDRLMEEGSMRSLSAILRIGQEQLDARGRLGKYRNMAFVGGVLAISVLFAAPFLPKNLKSTVQGLQIGAAVLCAGSVLLLWRVRDQLEKNLEEEVQIRKMILEASQRVVTAPGFFATPLSDDQRGTLRESIRKNNYDGALSEILDVH